MFGSSKEGGEMEGHARMAMMQSEDGTGDGCQVCMSSRAMILCRHSAVPSSLHHHDITCPVAVICHLS